MQIAPLEESKKDSFGLYKSQQLAAKQLEAWWRSTELEATLKGFAGTGKTFLMKYFIEHIVDKSFTITAPTHKALTVLQKHIGIKGLTLQSLHGLKPNTELSTFDIDSLSFDTIGNPKMRNYSLIIIDESSMINTSLFELNRERMKEYGVKVLYVGDPLQLPPIKEDESQVFKSVKTVIELDTVIRQTDGNPLLHLFTLLRDDIKNQGSTCLNYITENPNNIKNGVGYKMVDMAEYKSLMTEYFSDDKFYANIDYVRSTAFTNLMVNTWNTHIRNAVFDTRGESIIIEDLLTSYKTLVDDNMNAIITNSEDYVIQDINDYRNEYGLDVKCVILKSASTLKDVQMLQVLDHTKPENVRLYIKILTSIRENCIASNKRGKWMPYYAFKNKILAMIDVEVAGKPIPREIDYGYTLTTHKLQGSTFDNIFVDGRDICLPISKWGKPYKNDINLRNRLLYVALSRAKYIAYIRF